MADAMKLVPVPAMQRLILAADSYGVKHLDSDDMDDAATELQDATEAMKDLLAAAPAVEGGVVEHGLHEVARKMFAAEYPGRNYDDLDPGVRIGWLGSAHVEILAALTTREEAPAEAGEDWTTLADLHTIKGWLHGLATAPDLSDVVADGGASVGDCYQQEAIDFAGRIDHIISTLRAQPQAPALEGGAIETVARAIDPDAWAHVDACHEAMKTCGADELKTLRKVIEKRLDNSGSISVAERVLAALATREETPVQAWGPDLMTRAASWMAARQLHPIDGKDLIAEVRAAALTTPAKVEVVPVGYATEMCGGAGKVSMGIFDTATVPVGSPLYTTPPAPEADKLREALGVKPLDWRKPTKRDRDEGGRDAAIWIAPGFGGEYAIQSDLKNFILWRIADPYAFDTFPTVEAAKAHAEDDWQTTIGRKFAALNAEVAK